MTIKSCIRCKHFIRCKDARKSITFSCDRFGISKESLETESAFLSNALEMPFTTSTATGLALPSGYQPADPNDTESSFNASTVLNEMLKDKRIVSPDLKIPEGDFQEAPNFYKWCASDKFLDQKPFVMQALIGIRLFAEYCPDCSEVEWMEHSVRVNDSLGKLTRKVALLEFGKCPYCKRTKLDFYRAGTLNPYYELSLSAGQRSGKSALFGMMASYLTHRMIKLERPNEVFGLLKANVLQGTFVALTHQQAKETLYEPFYGHLLDAPWFQEYHEMLDQVQSHHGEDSVYKLKDTFVFYRHRRLQVYPAGPDKRILRGRTRFVSGIDELGWFPNDVASDKNVKMNANQVYIALERSLLTVRAKAKAVVKSGFYNVPFGYFINISSPSSVRDKIMELVRKAQGSTRTLGMCLPTWKMNPHVPRSALSEEFRNDPESAMRDYGAQPPLTNSPFISSHDKVENCFAKKIHYFKQIYHIVKSRDKTSSEVYTELDDAKQSGKASVMALDAGYCLAGDTLVSTSNGLLQLQDIGDFSTDTGKQRKLQKMFVGSSSKPAKPECWIDSGIKDVYLMTLCNGATLKPTPSHKVLVFRCGEHLWVESRDLLDSDALCFNPVQPLRSSKLPLLLEYPERRTLKTNTSGEEHIYARRGKFEVKIWANGKLNNFKPCATMAEAVELRTMALSALDLDMYSARIKSISLPTYMTPELAFAIGALISEGHYTKYSVNIGNTNLDFLHKVQKAFQENFGITGSILPQKICANAKFKSNKPMYGLHFYSAHLCDALDQLGLLSTAQHGRKSSYYKTIPWSILEADADSQLGFLTAYIEGDGSIRTDSQRIAVWSKSDKLLSQMQALLMCHGILANKRGMCLSMATTVDACNLYVKMEPYLTHKASDTYATRTGRPCKLYGFDASWLSDVLQARKEPRPGNYYRTDIGTVIRLDKSHTRLMGKRLLYESFDAGQYDYLLQVVKSISKNLHTKLLSLFKLRYRYVGIKSIANFGKVRTYDLSIAKDYDSAFTANGIVVHNSGNSFAFAIGHLAPNGYPVIALVGEIMPQPGIRINHSLVYSELLSDLVPTRNVVMVSADRWNSLKVLADAEQDFGIEKRQHSLKYVDMQLFKSYIDDGQILLPRPSKPIAEIVKYDQSAYPQCFKHLPADHLALQMLTVQDTGSAILKGDQLTDDILRAVMLCFRMLVDEDNLELLTQADSVSENMDMSKMAVSKHYSGGGSMGSGGMGGGQQTSSLGTLRQRQ